MPDLHVDLFERLRKCRLTCICCSTVGNIEQPVAEEEVITVGATKEEAEENESIHTNSDSSG